jgi:hypothetical protein
MHNTKFHNKPTSKSAAQLIPDKQNSVPINLNTLFTASFVVIPAILYLVRAWQYIINPQLFAEDGSVWLASAYNQGFKSLFSPYNGFVHSAERIYALFVVCLPLKLAPFIFNMGGFSLFIIMCYYLFTSRTDLLTTNYQKLFVSLSLGLIANFTEFFFNFSNSIFLLGIIGLCIYLAKPSNYRAIRVLEKIAFTIICLTLTFAWLFLPIVLFDRFRFKKRRNFYLVASLLGGIVQLGVLILTAHSRSTVPITTLFSSKYTLLIIFNQIITPALLFARPGVNIAIQIKNFLPILISFILMASFALFVIYKKATLGLRYLIFFAAFFTIMALRSPIVGGGLMGTSTLKFLAITPEENRYFFYAILASTTILALAINSYSKRWAAYLILIIFMTFGTLISVSSDSWYIHKNFFVNYAPAYSTDITALNHSAPGTTFNIPENPVGWSIKLRSH